MTAFNQKKTVGTYAANTDLYVTGHAEVLDQVVFDEATATYTPAIGDVLCRKTDDANKHQKYSDADLANLVILGIVDGITTDNTATPNVILAFAKVAEVHFSALGYGGTLNAAEKLLMLDSLRAINIDVAA